MEFFKDICNKHFKNVFKMFGKNVMFLQNVFKMFYRKYFRVTFY